MEEWVNEFQWHHTTEGNTTIKKDKLLPFTATQKDLENIIQGETSHTEKHKYHIILRICGT